MASNKTSDININVTTDEHNIPHEMKWTATDANIHNKAFSLFR